MNRRRHRAVAALVTALLVGLVAAVTWTPVTSLMTIDRTDVDLSDARAYLETMPSTSATVGSSDSDPSDDTEAPSTSDRTTSLQAGGPSTSSAAAPSSADTPFSAGTPPTNSEPSPTDPWTTTSTAPTESTSVPPTTTSTTVPDLDEDLVVVLVGSDARPPFAGARADVIVVAQAPADRERPVTLVSLPRDMVVEVPCFGKARINAALNGCEDVSGLELLGVTVEDWTGLTVDHMAAVDFGGFENVVDAVGGYPVCLDHDIRDDEANLDLSAGCQTLDGSDTLAWLRSRTPERLVDGVWEPAPVSDLARTDRQRDLLVHVLKQVRELEGAGAVRDMVASVANSMTIDSKWSVGSIVEDALAIRERSVEEGHVATDPFTDERGRALLSPIESYDEARNRILES